MYLFEEGGVLHTGNTFFKGLRFLNGKVGVDISTIAAMASAAKAQEFTGPDYTQCPAHDLVYVHLHKPTPADEDL